MSESCLYFWSLSFLVSHEYSQLTVFLKRCNEYRFKLVWQTVSTDGRKIVENEGLCGSANQKNSLNYVATRNTHWFVAARKRKSYLTYLSWGTPQFCCWNAEKGSDPSATSLLGKSPVENEVKASVGIEGNTDCLPTQGHRSFFFERLTKFKLIRNRALVYIHCITI